MSMDQSVRFLNLNWNEKRFHQSKSSRDAAKRSIYRAMTVLIKSETKIFENQNEEIQNEILRCHSDLHKYEEKLQTLDNMTQLATESLEIYFEKRMENLGAFVREQCRTISAAIQEEAEHWKEIHAMLQQKLVVPGDLRSYGGGNGLPRPVQQSPDVSQIIEEEDERSSLLHGRTLTPLLTETLKQARLLQSKLSQNGKSSLEVSTLNDVSVIEKETIHPLGELSVSLLPSVPTMDVEDKTIISTISDKTFIKSSAKGFSSDEEDEDEEDEEEEENETIVEQSFSNDPQENARPLLFTADRSIRRQALESIVENDDDETPRALLLETICPSIVVKTESPEKIIVKPRRMTRLLREIQLDENPIELPIKTRYPTRYSTRLAAAAASNVQYEETTNSRRRTMRFRSE